MKAVFQKSLLQNEYPLPPSKSLLHRYLFSAAMAEGESVLEGVTAEGLCDDLKATVNALKSLGVSIAERDGSLLVNGIDFAKEKAKKAVIDCEESATTLRFMIPLLLLGGGDYRLLRRRSLAMRPIGPYPTLFRDARFAEEGNDLILSGTLCGGDFSLDGNISSQFVSGLLFALPKTKEGGRILLNGKIESRPYIEMTRAILKDAGTRSEWSGSDVLSIPGNQRYRTIHTSIEADASARAYLDTLLAFAGLNFSGQNKTLQGDAVYADILKRMNAGERCFDLSDTPDLAPMLFAYAGTLGAPTVFTGTHRLRIKESDRIQTMGAELEKFGISLAAEENAVTVCPPKTLLPPSVPLQGHGDHRVIMALSVLLTKTGGTIEGIEEVKKSDPAFFQRLKSGGIAFAIQD